MSRPTSKSSKQPKSSTQRPSLSHSEWLHQSKQSRLSDLSKTTASSPSIRPSIAELIGRARSLWPDLFQPAIPSLSQWEKEVQKAQDQDHLDARGYLKVYGESPSAKPMESVRQLDSVMASIESSAPSAAPTTAPSSAPTTATSTGALKFDDGKVPTDLFSIPAYMGVCKILQFGAKKYAAWNWSKGLMYMRVYAATLRHLMAWASGEDNDKETGLSHIDHAMCELMFLSHFIKNPDKYKGLDDRPYGKVA